LLNSIQFKFNSSCIEMLFMLQFHLMIYFFHFKKIKKKFLFIGIIYLFVCFFNTFSLSANKDSLLHVTNCIISSLPFGWNSFISMLFQHVMLLTHEHVLLMMFKIYNHNGVISILCMVFNFLIYFFFCFIDHTLYDFVWFLAIM